MRRNGRIRKDKRKRCEEDEKRKDKSFPSGNYEFQMLTARFENETVVRVAVPRETTDDETLR